MASELELVLFEGELRAVRSLPEASRWTLERDKDVPLGVFVAMHPIRKVNEDFKARLRWDGYFAPPSLKFVSLTTGSEKDPSAWPQCYGFRPASLDACLPWTKEGQNLHPEWKGSIAQSFPSVECPLQYVLLRLQHALDDTYQGRGCT